MPLFRKTRRLRAIRLATRIGHVLPTLKAWVEGGVEPTESLPWASPSLFAVADERGASRLTKYRPNPYRERHSACRRWML